MNFKCTTISMARSRLAALAAPLAMLLCLASVSTVAADGQQPQPTLPKVELRINDKTLIAEVASSGEQRYMGLSFRKSLGDDEGMLFVFEKERPLTFTMRNTLIPLSIAFISRTLVINEIHKMDVGPNQLFPSRKNAQFALEVDQGWFEENGIKAGDRIVNFTPMR